MNENFAVGPAEDEPGIAFIRYAAIGLQGKARLEQRVLNAIKLGNFLL
jgi:hypothetical protein